MVIAMIFAMVNLSVITKCYRLTERPKIAYLAVMTAMLPIVMDFRPAYDQLDPGQRRFVDAYVSDLETMAQKTGERLLVILQRPYPYPLDHRAMVLLGSALVRTAICERVKTLSELTDVSTYRTLKELCSIAYSNVGNFVEIDPKTGWPDFNWSKVTNEQLAAVKSIEIDHKPRGGVRYKFVLHDKLGALNTLARYQGLITDDGDHWNKQQREEKKATAAPGLPATVNDDQAARAYADYVNTP